MDNQQPFTFIWMFTGHWLYAVFYSDTYCILLSSKTLPCPQLHISIWILNNLHKNDLAIITQQNYDISLWLSSWTPKVLRFFTIRIVANSDKSHSWWFSIIFRSSFVCCSSIINYDKPIGFGSKMFHKIIGREQLFFIPPFCHQKPIHSSWMLVIRYL